MINYETAVRTSVILAGTFMNMQHIKLLVGYIHTHSHTHTHIERSAENLGNAKAFVSVPNLLFKGRCFFPEPSVFICSRLKIYF